MSEWMQWAQNTEHVFDLRRVTIRKRLSYLTELKSGRSLTDPQAIELYELYRFLHGTVAPHQYEYPEIGRQVIERWLTEMDMRSRYPEGWDCLDILNDRVVYCTLHNPWARKQYPNTTEFSFTPTPEENKLTGLYVSRLATLGQIAGVKRLKPAEIIQKFLGKQRVTNL
ncbi:MAG: hypothetical protein V4690_01400 [Patescibacteria group bacterium]